MQGACSKSRRTRCCQSATLAAAIDSVSAPCELLVFTSLCFLVVPSSHSPDQCTLLQSPTLLSLSLTLSLCTLYHSSTILCLSLSLFLTLSVFVSICLFLSLYLCLSLYLLLSLSVCLCLSVCLSLCLSLSLSRCTLHYSSTLLFSLSLALSRCTLRYSSTFLSPPPSLSVSGVGTFANSRMCQIFSFCSNVYGLRAFGNDVLIFVLTESGTCFCLLASVRGGQRSSFFFWPVQWTAKNRKQS